MLLSDAMEEKILKVNGINTDFESKKKILSLGIQTDDLIIKLSGTPWGAILVKNLTGTNSKVAIGRGIAKRIDVVYEA